MLTGRRTKLLIAVAILLVGMGAALLFRREEALQTTTAPKKTAPADIAARSSPASDSRASAVVEPTLAGRIEPYAGWNYGGADRGDETAAEQGVATGPGVESKLESIGVQRRSKQEPSAPERPASFASAAHGPAAQVDSLLQRPTIGRSGDAGSAELAEQSSAAFERFADQRPLRGGSTDGKRHKIIDGDTLAAIARRYLGAEQRYVDIFEHNRDVLATPELLPIGQELRIPPPDFVRPAEPASESPATSLTAVAPPPAAPPDSVRAPDARSIPPASMPHLSQSPSVQTYVVQAHDTLALIARKVYGDIGRQAELMAANRQQLRTPQDLRPGMTLVVPGARKSE